MYECIQVSVYERDFTILLSSAPVYMFLVHTSTFVSKLITALNTDEVN